MLTALRVLAGIAIAVATATALIPLLVVADLAGGGSGWGLCPQGLGTCSVSYFAGPELFLLLVAVLFVSLATLGLSLRGIRHLDARGSETHDGVSGPR